jgi:hypothetical protein
VSTSAPTSGRRSAPRRPARNARRVGYTVAVVINLALLWAVNVTPGWRWIPVLTEDFSAIVGFVSISLLVGAGVNLLYLAVDPPWLRRLGDAVTGGVAVVVLVLLVRDFPFALGGAWSASELPLRILLGLAAVGTAIGVVANLAVALREVLDPPDTT